MSQLGWIDFSPDDRNKVRNVLAMLSEPGTLDELGVGQVRDAFSDLLFPGISTIQTRAKYFITVPRILRDYQALTPSKKRNYQSLKKYLIYHENEVAKILVAVHDDSEDGIIGRTRITSGGVDRRPSEVYWNGLRTFGLIKTQLSLAEFSRKLDDYDHHNDMLDSDHADGNDDADALKNRNLIDLPDNNHQWMDKNQLRIQLNYKEAEFLKGKLIETSGIELSVPTQLFKCHLVHKALAENTNKALQAIDVLTELMLSHDDVNAICKQRIQTANQFSLAMEGPHIRYNIILAKNNGFDDSVDKYEEAYAAWFEKANAKNLFKQGSDDKWLGIAAGGIDQKRVFKNITKDFIKKWCEALRQNTDHSQLDEIVAKQAERNKGGRSLLKRKLSENKWMGIRRLDFRWGSARTIIKDIQEGLNVNT